MQASLAGCLREARDEFDLGACCLCWHLNGDGVLQSDKSFIMEVCTRTEADKKGGHLAVRKADNQLLLRESAQCADEDEKDFQNTDKHR